jgi:hypothetical protein
MLIGGFYEYGHRLSFSIKAENSTSAERLWMPQEGLCLVELNGKLMLSFIICFCLSILSTLLLLCIQEIPAWNLL